MISPALPIGALVTRGDVPATIEDAVVRRVCMQASRDTFLLTLPHLGRILARNGREVVVDAPDAPASTVQRYLDGPVAAALHQQLGRLVIDGAAVTDGTRTVVLAGRSGAGTSTVAAHLIGNGWTLVSDEHVALDGRAPLPGSGRLTLWPDAIVDADLHGVGAPCQDGSSKRVLDVAAHPAPPPTDAIIVLARAPHLDLDPTSDRLRGGAAMIALASHLRDDTGGDRARRLELMSTLLHEVRIHGVSWRRAAASTVADAVLHTIADR